MSGASDESVKNEAAMAERVKAHFTRAVMFIRKDVWHDPDPPARLRLFCYQALRVILLTVSGLRDQLVFLRASALCYSTLLAIVPLLAVAFSMLKGLGVHSQIEHLLVNYLTAEQEAVSKKIIEYISNTDFKALGAFGTALLIFAVLMMLSNVERTFNDLWGVSRNRSMVRKISDYISVLILGPLLIVISTALMTSFSSHAVVNTLSRYEVFEQFFVLFKTIVPYAGLWIAFTAMYMLMPNTRVRFLPALISGILFGSLWQLAFQGYTTFNVGVARYNTIYGTFAALPIFIVWLYISWIIVLIGAKMSYAIQNVRTHQREFKDYTVGQEEREEMAVHVMLKIAEQFHRGAPPLTEGEVSKVLSMPVALVRETISRLAAEGLVREVYGEEPRYQPGRNPNLISVLDVCRAMRNSHAQSRWALSGDETYPALENLMQTMRSMEASQLGKSSMLDLLESVEKSGDSSQ